MKSVLCSINIQEIYHKLLPKPPVWHPLLQNDPNDFNGTVLFSGMGFYLRDSHLFRQLSINRHSNTPSGIILGNNTDSALGLQLKYQFTRSSIASLDQKHIVKRLVISYYLLLNFWSVIQG